MAIPSPFGNDLGSKKEAFTVKSASHTYLNIQVDAVTWVKENEETSTMMRRSRKTPYRRMRKNRNINKVALPPSTKARWQWKLRLIQWLAKGYPLAYLVVEDITATTRLGKNRPWNQSFSPLEVGKAWFYEQLETIAPVVTRRGYETKVLRDALCLKKSQAKLSDKFNAHCVDSWVLANDQVGGHTAPDNTAMLYPIPLGFHRRQLHALQFVKGSMRRVWDRTISMGFKRGTWVKHPKYGVCFVGGTSKERISLHSLQDGKRLCQNAQPADCQFLTYASWRLRKAQAHSA